MCGLYMELCNYKDCFEMNIPHKWPFYNHFCPFFHHMYYHQSQNWDPDGHFEMLNRSVYSSSTLFFLGSSLVMLNKCWWNFTRQQFYFFEIPAKVLHNFWTKLSIPSIVHGHEKLLLPEETWMSHHRSLERGIPRCCYCSREWWSYYRRKPCLERRVEGAGHIDSIA